MHVRLPVPSAPEITPTFRHEFWNFFYELPVKQGVVDLPSSLHDSDDGRVVLAPSIERSSYLLRAEAYIAWQKAGKTLAEVRLWGDWFNAANLGAAKAVEWALLDAHSKLRREALSHGIQIDWVVENKESKDARFFD